MRARNSPSERVFMVRRRLRAARAGDSDEKSGGPRPRTERVVTASSRPCRGGPEVRERRAGSPENYFRAGRYGRAGGRENGGPCLGRPNRHWDRAGPTEETPVPRPGGYSRDRCGPMKFSILVHAGLISQPPKMSEGLWRRNAAPARPPPARRFISIAFIFLKYF